MVDGNAAPRITSGPVTDLGVNLDDVVNMGATTIVGSTPHLGKIFLEGVKHNASMDYLKEERDVLPAVDAYLAENGMYIARLQVVQVGRVYSGDLYGPRTNGE